MTVMYAQKVFNLSALYTFAHAKMQIPNTSSHTHITLKTVSPGLWSTGVRASRTFTASTHDDGIRRCVCAHHPCLSRTSRMRAAHMRYHVGARVQSVRRAPRPRHGWER